MNIPFFNHSYSRFNPNVLDQNGRTRIASQILAVLAQELKGKSPKDYAVLDVGCSSGVIASRLASVFGRVVGIDTDQDALAQARPRHRKNLRFCFMDATRMAIADASIDVVVCNQVCHLIRNQEELMTEMFRVLRPGGLCYFSTNNRLRLWEPDYRLPLLPLFPKPLIRTCLALVGKKEVFELSYRWLRELRSLCCRFAIRSYTPEILHDPRRYQYRKLLPFQRFFHAVPLRLWEMIEPFSPTLVWVLEKPRVRGRGRLGR